MSDEELPDVTPIRRTRPTLSSADEVRTRMYRETEARTKRKAQQVKRCACAGCRDLDVHVFKVAGAIAYVCVEHCLAFENDEGLRAFDNELELHQVEVDAHVNAGNAGSAMRAQTGLHAVEAEYRKAFRNWLQRGGSL